MRSAKCVLHNPLRYNGIFQNQAEPLFLKG